MVNVTGYQVPVNQVTNSEILTIGRVIDIQGPETGNRQLATGNQ